MEFEIFADKIELKKKTAGKGRVIFSLTLNLWE